MHRRSEALKRAGLLIEADDIAYAIRKLERYQGSDQKERRGGSPSMPAGATRPKCPPKNCFRHSFATYHVALHRDAGKTALIMSHRNQQILFQHYLGIATEEQAERYFQIRPSNRTRKR